MTALIWIGKDRLELVKKANEAVVIEELRAAYPGQ